MLSTSLTFYLIQFILNYFVVILLMAARWVDVSSVRLVRGQARKTSSEEILNLG